MKTIIVCYTNNILDSSNIGTVKKYAFNTKNSVEVNDFLQSAAYTTNMQVVKVLDKSYKYFNQATGELSDEYTSTAQWFIKELAIREDDSNVIYASKILV